MFELRQAYRGLVRRPAYSAACIGTLALVIGVNAALFAAINATLFRPIPLKSGDRTVQLYLLPPGPPDPNRRNPLHESDLVRVRERSRTLTHIAAFTTADRVLGAATDPAVVSTAPVSAEMLRLAIQGPVLGRIFTDDEETRKERLVVLSHGAWQRRFGGDPGVVGRTLQLDGEPSTAIGVMPPQFPPTFLAAELFTPLGVTRSAPDDGRTYLVTLAQLADSSYVTNVDIENQPTPDGSSHTVQFRRVSTSYFTLLRIRVREGRVFERTDSLSSPPAAVISQSFADRYWPGVDTIGRRLKRGSVWMTVIGVVDDVSDVDLLQPAEPTVYAAWTQTANVAFPMGLLLRTNSAPEALAPQVRAAIASVDPMLAVDHIQSVETFFSASLAPQAFRTTLMLGLAGVGLLLGAIGIAGVTARTIAERMPEFGVRLALGCAGADLWRHVVVDQLRIVLTGAALGVGLAAIACRLLAALLPETARFDGAVVAGAVALLVATATLAAAIPASRVLRLSPLAVLRQA